MRQELDSKVYSSVILGPGARGAVDLFTIPLGQPVTRLGRVPKKIGVSGTRLHTNLFKAGELGSGIGNFKVFAVEPQLLGATLEDAEKILAITEFQLLVSARDVCNGPLRSIGGRLHKAIEIQHLDSLRASITIRSALSIKRAVLVTVVLHGIAWSVVS